MILAFQGLREGSGATLISSSIAWHLSRFRSSVMAVSTLGSACGFSCAFNLSPKKSNSSPFWQYCSHLTLFCPQNASQQLSLNRLDSFLSSALDRGITDIIVDLDRNSAEAELWKKRADILVTVCVPDEHTLLRLKTYGPEANELFVVNKALTFSKTTALITQTLLHECSLKERFIEYTIVWDEYAAQAARCNGPVAQLAPQAECSRTICALGTWLAVRSREDRLCWL